MPTNSKAKSIRYKLSTKHIGGFFIFYTIEKQQIHLDQEHCGGGMVDYEDITGDKSDTPTNVLESGTNHMNIGNLTLSDVVNDDRDDYSDFDSHSIKKWEH